MNSTLENGGLIDGVAVTAAAWGAIGVALLIWLVVVPIGLQGVFVALGERRAKAWAPFVNIATVYRLGGMSEYWLIALVVPITSVIGVVILFVASHRITKRLGHGGGWTVLAVFVWWLWALVMGSMRADARPVEPVVWSVQPRPQPVVSLRSDNSTTPPPPPSPLLDATPAEPPAAAQVAGPVAEPLAELRAEPPAAVPDVLRAEPLAEPFAESLVEPAPEAAPLAPTAAYEHVRLEAEPQSAAFEPAELAASAPLFEPDDDATIISSGVDQTVISALRRPRWWVRTTAGARIELEGRTAILGRRPAAHPLYPGAQLVVVTDPVTSVSATHAALEFLDGDWQITDLGSTNGVWLVDELTGEETELGARNRARVPHRFLLGELGVQVSRDA